MFLLGCIVGSLYASESWETFEVHVRSLKLKIVTKKVAPYILLIHSSPCPTRFGPLSLWPNVKHPKKCCEAALQSQDRPRRQACDMGDHDTTISQRTPKGALSFLFFSAPCGPYHIGQIWNNLDQFGIYCTSVPCRCSPRRTDFFKVPCSFAGGRARMGSRG